MTINFFNRLAGVFFNPRETFRALSEKPVWLDALIILLILLAVYGYFTGPIAQQDGLRMLENNVKFRERVGEDQYKRIIESMKNPASSGVVLRSLVIGPVTTAVGFLIQCAFLLIMGRLVSTQGKYHQVFAALLQANFIDKILGNALRLILILGRKSVMETSTGLAMLFPKLEATSTAYLALSQVDFFQLWMFGVLGFGLSSILKIEMKKAMVISYSFWLLKSLANFGFSLLSLRLTGL